VLILVGGIAGIQQTRAAEPPPEPTPTGVLKFEDVAGNPTGDPIDGAFAWYSGTTLFSWVANCPFGHTEVGVGTFVSQYRDQSNNLPVPGDVYYLSVVVYGVGNPCSTQEAYIDIGLPPNTSLAISGTNPVICDNNGTLLPAPDCPQTLPASTENPGAYEIESPLGLWPIPVGYYWEFLIPVVSSASVPGDLFKAAVHMFDGNSFPWLVPSVQVLVYPPSLPAPGAFNKTSPTHNATKSTSLTLVWAASSDVSYYQYCIDTINDSSCNTSWTSTGTSTSKALSGLAAGSTYFWQVRAVNTSGTTYANSGGWWRFYTSAASGSDPVADFDGNGDTDVSVYRPSNGRWYIDGMGNFKWGLAGDLPVPGDYDGDDTTDIAIFRPSNGKWYVMGETPASWGTSGDIPVQADYTGDGSTDKAVLRKSTKRWYIQGVGNMKWYFPGDIPVPCDYDGDGSVDVAIYRPSNNKWYVVGDSPAGWGQSGDIPVPADYDGDGSCDIAVFRPSNGTWYVRGQGSTTWGSSGDIPVPGDYDGNGDTEFAVLRPSNGKWYIKDVGTFSWYASGDFPLPVRDTNADGDPYQ
jgi:hypothetical protein